jgi:peroxiredoxin
MRVGAVWVLVAMGIGSRLWAAETGPVAAQKTNSAEASAAMRIAASAADATPLQKGAIVPDVTVQTVDGKSVALRSVLAEKPTVLVFYRGFWCPFCNTQLAGLESIAGQLGDRGYQIVAISPDTPEHARGTVDRHKLTYTVLADPDHRAITAFGLAFDAHNAAFPVLPVPAVYFLHGTTIDFVHSNPDDRQRMADADIIKEATALKAASADAAPGK